MIGLYLKRMFWLLFGMLSAAIGLYPLIYFVNDRKFGLLSSKSDELLLNLSWNIGFYTHIMLGGLALLIGWSQFISSIRNRWVHVHRTIGKIYVGAVLLSALAGIYIGFYATGGIITALGFIGLGIVWFSSTLGAYLYIRRGAILKHRQMMVYSYAACFAAVTLRIYLPLLIMYFGDFITAYTIVAWLSWIPNITVAYFIARRLKPLQLENTLP